MRSFVYRDSYCDTVLTILHLHGTIMNDRE